MIRTRFAPSPTGFMHVGNLRTALYAYLIAKHENGHFILRIEDTDKRRYVEGALDAIYKALETAGLAYDEGPDKDGGYGPYTQSERLPIYRKYAEELVEKGLAYYCFCEKEEHIDAGEESELPVAGERDVCRNLLPEEVKARLAQNSTPAIRQRIPDSGTTTYQDTILGEITFDNTLLDDQILLKSDGFPTYNFANVVDDHLMQITHVVRGQEYISSTPKYQLLYEAFGWQPPVYIHVPLIVNDDGSKMSKRKGAPTLEQMVASGYLPSAIVNYVALLGWNPGTDQEIFTLEELVKVFDYKRINKSPAGFSMAKLRWLNGEHIRRLSPEEFHSLALTWYPETMRNFDLAKISKLIQIRTECLGEISEMTHFLVELPSYENALYINNKSKSSLDSSRQILTEVLPILEKIEAWSNDSIFERLKAYAGEKNLKVGTVMWPIRTALSGLAATPGGATELADLLGKEESLRRLKIGLEQLQG